MLLNKSIYSGEEIDVLMPIHNSEKKLLIKSLESIFLQNIRVRLICILNGMSKEKNAEYISLLNKFVCTTLGSIESIEYRSSKLFDSLPVDIGTKTFQ